MRFAFILIIISIVSIIIVFVLSLLFKKKRYVKYIPAIILSPFMIYNFVTMNSVTSEGFQSLGRFVMGILILDACASALITSIAIDVHYRINERKSKHF
jgi:hypothetical protein